MTFYGNILVSAMRFFRHFRSERSSYASALFFTGVSQVFCFIAAFGLLNNVLHIDVPFEYARYLFVGIFIAWLIGLSMYYSLTRVEQLAAIFEQKSDSEKLGWGIVAILSYAVPAAIFIFM